MRLDISIGPVQGFVAQSRRTRDLWGSSYLLSYLCAHAMHGAEQADGRFIQPDAEVVEKDPLYRWVRDRREGEPPRIGTVSNHFVVEVEGDEGEVRNVAEAAKQALDDAWKRVCRAVWEHFVKPACPSGNATDGIWNRQVDGFWEVMWTAGDVSTEGGLLGRRKHWRSHRPPEEPGDKCTVIHNLQELSGYVRGERRTSRDLQDRFWKTVGERLGRLDLRDNERLCAVALVKRLFPKVAVEALGWPVDASHWPSTVYVGAVPWIRRVVQTEPGLAQEYAEAVKQGATDVLAEHKPLFAGLEKEKADDFARLDANYMHRESVADERRCPLNDDAVDGTREKLGGLLQAVCDARDEAGHTLGPPSVFYALLLADGDRVGKLVGELGGETVSKALAAFTNEVPQIVREFDGVTVYAGGDDVLAMLPVPGALDCADKLADAYRAAFKDTEAPARATLSAAVLFAHVRLPLNHVVDEAHRLLDDVAKDGNGRNSLVAAVLKPGGMQCQWVTTWDRSGPDGEVRAVGSLGNLIEQLKSSATEPGLSSSLIYRMRDTLTRLCGWDQWRPGNWGTLPQGLDVRAFLRAEIHHSLDVRMDSDADARAGRMTASVWNLLGPARNTQGDKPDAVPGDNENAPVTEAGVDSLLLARFLADHEEQE